MGFDKRGSECSRMVIRKIDGNTDSVVDLTFD